MAIQQVNHSRCIGCRTCVITCPCDVLRMDGKRAVAQYPSDCQICRMCENYCPVGAITVTSDKTMPILTAWG